MDLYTVTGVCVVCSLCVVWQCVYGVPLFGKIDTCIQCDQLLFYFSMKNVRVRISNYEQSDLGDHFTPREATLCVPLLR
jgi:hypothetical protein